MRFLFAIVLASYFPSCLCAPCHGCVNASELLEVQKQLELLTNKVKTLLENSEDSSCNESWIAVYENDARGQQIGGSLQNLISDVRAGASVRVLLDNTIYQADFVHILQGKTVAVQLLQSVARATWNTLKKNGEWEWKLVSTSGFEHQVRYDIGASTFRGDQRNKVAVKWFTKQQSCSKKPVLSHDRNGAILSGSLVDLMTSIKEGSDIRCFSPNSAFPIQSLEMTKSLVSGQNVHHVSVTIDSGGKELVFQNNAYWWFTLHSTLGTRDMSRWTVGEHTSRGHTQSRVDIDWFADPCWKLVFAHDKHGVAKSGSRANLVRAIKNGARVRVQTPSYRTAEADNLSIRNGHVTAQLLKRLSEKSLTRIANDTSWYWQMISTTGKVMSTLYKVGEHQHVSTTSSYQEIRWYIDTKPWILVYSHNAQGQALHGSEGDVVRAVQSGAAMRGLYESSSRNGYTFPIQNLRIYGNHVSGQHFNYVSMQNSPTSQYEMQLKPNPYWRFGIFTTQGRLEMSRWSVGQHTSRGHYLGSVGLKWFANY